MITEDYAYLSCMVCDEQGIWVETVCDTLVIHHEDATTEYDHDFAHPQKDRMEEEANDL